MVKATRRSKPSPCSIVSHLWQWCIKYLTSDKQIWWVYNLMSLSTDYFLEWLINHLCQYSHKYTSWITKSPRWYIWIFRFFSADIRMIFFLVLKYSDLWNNMNSKDIILCQAYAELALTIQVLAAEETHCCVFIIALGIGSVLLKTWVICHKTWSSAAQGSLWQVITSRANIPKGSN